MKYEQIPGEYNAENGTLGERTQEAKDGIELLAKSTTRLEEPNSGNLEYGIDACGCPCPCPCITDIEGTIISVAVHSAPWMGVSVL